MKRLFLYHIVVFIISTGVYGNSGISEIPGTPVITGPGEKIRLFTDRNVYVVNETIFFTASYSSDSEADSVSWSQVLYVELMTWNGIKLAGSRLRIDKSGASSSLRIPGDLLSGNYYLRAYTKWMRNFPVNSYEYRLIKIVNPFHAETVAGPSEISDSGRFVIKLNSSGQFVRGIHCSMNKNQYLPRETATVEMYISDENSVAGHDFCVSVVKAGSVDTSVLLLNPEVETSKIKWDDIEYLPEIAGITISGKVIDKISRIPKENVFINLSETDHGEFFSAYQTSDKGRFVFTLPDLYGKYNFFIQTEPSDTGSSTFLIDNEFCNRPVSLPYIPFSIQEHEKNQIRDMIVTMQLNEKFSSHTDTLKTSDNNPYKPVAFYGSGIRTYYTGNYIELPTIEDFFIEIVLGANIVSNKGKTELKNFNISGFSNYPPLIFLDNIRVNNDDRLFKLPLDRIERVEAIESGYIVGNLKYGGLFSIYSKNEDYAAIELENNHMFFSYDAFSYESIISNSGDNSIDSRIPVRKSLLYWNPDIQLSAGKKTTITFNTSDDKGDYVVYIYGKNNRNEKVVYGKSFFSIQ